MIDSTSASVTVLDGGLRRADAAPRDDLDRAPDGARGAPLRIALADDHALVRAGLCLLVDAQPDMRVVGEAGDGEAAWRVARELQPDLLVLDLSMPGRDGAHAADGADVTTRVRRDCPEVRVLVLTVHEERVYLTRQLRAGATGYVLKRAAAADLVRAIRLVAAGGVYLDPVVADVVVGGFLEQQHADAARRSLPLSGREESVLRRIARGFSNKEIASDLALSVKTVETYKARVTEKLGLRTRVDIVTYASDQGWLGAAPRAD